MDRVRQLARSDAAKLAVVRCRRRGDAHHIRDPSGAHEQPHVASV